MRLGFDVDGVFADFNEKFIDYSVAVTGKDLYPARPFDITTWNYPESYGYTSAEVSAVWKVIKADPYFWLSIKPYRETRATLFALSYTSTDDIYFITNRMGMTTGRWSGKGVQPHNFPKGLSAKAQTDEWLIRNGFENPTVLLTKYKGLAAHALSLDAYIDDKWENCVDVATPLTGWPATKVFLMDRPWNYTHNAALAGIQRVSSIQQMLSLLA